MNRPYTARPWVGAPEERVAEGWAIAIVFALIWIACGCTL